ncbi:MAG: mechanosensitive ion channel [Nitrococcus sp.]|nr:mechanosensitive ion channel [Nitrococcus sp.]
MTITSHVPMVRTCRLRISIAVVFLALVLVAYDAGAQQSSPDFEDRVRDWQSQLKDAAAALEANFADADLDAVTGRLKQLTQQAQETKAVAETRLETAQGELGMLGEPPAKGEPAEEPELAKLRRELQRRIAQAKVHVTLADLVTSQANDLLSAIAAREEARVQAEFLQHTPPPIWPSVWRQAAADALAFANRVLTSPITWWQTRKQQEEVPFSQLWLLLLLPVVGLVIGWPIRHFLLARLGRNPLEPEPTYVRRIVKVFVDGLANSIVPVVIILLVTGVLAWLGVLTGLFAYLIYAIAVAIAVFLMVYGLSRAALSPQLVQWRIVPVEPAYTGKLLRAVGTVAGLLAISMVLLATAQTSRHLTPALEAVFFLAQATSTALALAWLLTPKYWSSSIAASQRLGTAEEHAEVLEAEKADEEPADEPRSIRLVRALRGLVLLTPILALAGYGWLAYYLQSRLMATGALVGLALLLRLGLREALEHLLTGRQRKRRKSSRRAAGNDPDAGVKIMVYWAGLGIDILLLVPLVYLLLLIYGVPLTTLGLWTQRLLAGITIGNITLSLTDILIALVVLVLGVLFTNLVRHWMATRLLPNTRLDTGARDSIAAGTSYVGVAIAILLAIASLGIDFSSLALIAGALSVGIGFGLQNLVQNFAAGIQLLVERPIKVGDWIIVGATQGTVKRISVRSTEIETFDRCSIFVPNSDLISNHVANWTHRNRVARLILPVRVALGSEPSQVEEVLLRCAREHRHVLRFPESYVWFRGFGEWALNFELRVYIDDADNWITVDNGLYFAIEVALREAGIVIPFPQRDLHIRGDQDENLQLDDEKRPRLRS